MGDSSSTIILIAVVFLLLVMMVGGGVVFTAVLCLRRRGRGEEEVSHRQRKKKAHQKPRVKTASNEHEIERRRGRQILGREILERNVPHGNELWSGHEIGGRATMEVHAARGEKELPATVIPMDYEEPSGTEITFRRPGVEIVHTPMNNAFVQMTVPPSLPRNSSRGLIHMQRNESYSLTWGHLPTNCASIERRKLAVERDMEHMRRNQSHNHGLSRKHITSSAGRGQMSETVVHTQAVKSDELRGQVFKQKNNASLIATVDKSVHAPAHGCPRTEGQKNQVVLMRRNEAYNCIGVSSLSGNNILLGQTEHAVRKENMRREMEMVKNEAYTAITERREDEDEDGYIAV